MMRNEASDPPLNHDHTAPFPSKARVVAGGRLNVRSRGSRRWMTIVLATLFAIGASSRMSWAIAPRHQQSTDDAYVSGNIVQVMPQIAGTVVTVGADDHQFVRVGQLVVELDDGDARIAVERAHVQLDNTVREVCERYAKTARLHTCIDRNSMRNYS
jgi:membrane fusion protein (multidrug efflux system)